MMRSFRTIDGIDDLNQHHHQPTNPSTHQPTNPPPLPLSPTSKPHPFHPVGLRVIQTARLRSAVDCDTDLVFLFHVLVGVYVVMNNAVPARTQTFVEYVHSLVLSYILNPLLSLLSASITTVINTATGTTPLDRTLARLAPPPGSSPTPAALLEVISVLAAHSPAVYASAVSSGLDNISSLLADNGTRTTLPQHSLLSLSLLTIAAKASLGAHVDARTQPFDEDQDAPRLNTLWTGLVPDGDGPVPPRRSPEWGRLGFQGSDPGTDFRGMGKLALDHLVFLAEGAGGVDEHRRVVEACTQACGEPYYPWATAAINFTAFVVRSFRDGDLDGILARDVIAHPDGYSVPDATLLLAKIHTHVVLSFHDQWVAESPESIMAFPAISARVQAHVLDSF